MSGHTYAFAGIKKLPQHLVDEAVWFCVKYWQRLVEEGKALPETEDVIAYIMPLQNSQDKMSKREIFVHMRQFCRDFYFGYHPRTPYEHIPYPNRNPSEIQTPTQPGGLLPSPGPGRLYEYESQALIRVVKQMIEKEKYDKEDRKFITSVCRKFEKFRRERRWVECHMVDRKWDERVIGQHI